jgi:hypothetical protein
MRGLQQRAFPIAHAVGVEHVVRRGDRRLGRAGRGLAELHVDDRLRPSAFIWWARRLMAMAWKGSISEAGMDGT